MKNIREKLVDFRNTLYHLFPKRKDAIFELMDANSASTTSLNSVVHLSKSAFFTRQYPSITDALTDGLEAAQWDDIQKLIWCTSQPKDKAPYHRFVVDCTPQDRLHAKTLDDRTIVHKANPAPGNKPICAGHEYSTVVYVPPGSSKERKRWVVPVSTERVPSEQKGHELGMKQVARLMKQLGLEENFTLSIGDSAYATESCRRTVSTLKEHVHIARLRNNRKVFELLPVQAHSKGKPKIYGKKMTLNNPAHFLPHDEEVIIPVKSKKGSPLSLIIKGWNTVSFRGSRQFKAHQNPFRLLQLIVVDEHNKPMFKRPLWLSIFGEKRLAISLHECVENYRDRYDIEHYFRFGKQSLLMDSFQTYDTHHEESWWKLCALSYCQIYLSRELCRGTPEAWERYLPEFKGQDKMELVSAPFAKRGFSKLLDVIGTPAQKPIQRGNPLGRKNGHKLTKRVVMPIKFKQGVVDTKKKKLFSTFEKEVDKAKPQNINDIFEALNLMLKNIGISMEAFNQFVVNPK
jgi:hypothetical protein